MARTGRPRGFNRDDALQAAMYVFWQHGFEGASIDALRAAMGDISSASFYAAYRSKEALYREALERYLGTHGTVMVPLLNGDLPPRTRVEEALRASARMQSDADHPLGCMITLSATVSSPQGEAVGRATAELRRVNRDAIHEAVRFGIADGTLRPEAKDAGLADLLNLTLNGMSVAARDGVSTTSLDQAVSSAMRLWDSYTALS